MIAIVTLFTALWGHSMHVGEAAVLVLQTITGMSWATLPQKVLPTTQHRVQAALSGDRGGSTHQALVETELARDVAAGDAEVQAPHLQCHLEDVLQQQQRLGVDEE